MAHFVRANNLDINFRCAKKITFRKSAHSLLFTPHPQIAAALARVRQGKQWEGSPAAKQNANIVDVYFLMCLNSTMFFVCKSFLVVLGRCT